MYKRFGKRLLDIIASVLAIIILSPLIVLIGILLFFSIGTPIIFVQERIGKNEHVFKMYKFRTMTNEKDGNGNLLPEENRKTRIGAILRSTSLDELPELFCILMGKMSFVGPRPLPVYYGPYFLPAERRRHSVLGGLIPPDSLSKKTYTSFEEQFEYEVYYAEHVSLLMDIKVILCTFGVLLNRVETSYGDGLDRPHLNVYRAHMNHSDSERG